MTAPPRPSPEAVARHRRPPTRRARLLVLVALALVAAACSTERDEVVGSADQVTDPGDLVDVEQVPASPPRDVPSALGAIVGPDLPEPLVDPAEVVSGGPPPDGIPSIDRPRFLRPEDVGFLADQEPVLALEVDGDARAYPVQIMIWHEIVNDTVGGVPLAVTYCPLCNSAVAVDRRLGDEVLEFGTSGRLYRSSLVMYDRQTASLWSHFTGQAVAGVLTGEQLDRRSVNLVSWGEWRRANPDGLVLSRDTGEDRPYGRNPYPGYDDVGQPPFLFEGEVDGRLAAKERVVGLGQGSDPVAVLRSAVLEQGAIELEVDGRPVVVVGVAGTASALDAGDVAGGRDVGAVGAYVPEVAGRPVRLVRDGGGVADEATGSPMDVLGTFTAGPLAGRSLEPVPHVDTFWFAWGAFSPDTRLVP